MEIRRATLERDYKEIAWWWRKQDRAILAWQLLPTLSFLAEQGDEKIAVSWLYVTDSVTGFVAWTTVNPEVSKKLVAKALKSIDREVAIAAKMSGVRALFQFSGGGGFTRLLLKSGWKNTLIKHDFLCRGV